MNNNEHETKYPKQRRMFKSTRPLKRPISFEELAISRPVLEKIWFDGNCLVDDGNNDFIVWALKYSRKHFGRKQASGLVVFSGA